MNPLTALENFAPPPDLGSATGAGAATAGISGRDARREGTVMGMGGKGGKRDDISWGRIEFDVDKFSKFLEFGINFHQFY